MFAGGVRDAGGDALCATLYAGGCGGWAQFARGVRGAEGAGGDAQCTTLYAEGCGGWAQFRGFEISIVAIFSLQFASVLLRILWLKVNLSVLDAPSDISAFSCYSTLPQACNSVLD